LRRCLAGTEKRVERARRERDMKRKACTEETGNRVTCIWGLCIEAVGSRFWVYVRTMYCSKAWIRRRGRFR